LHLNTFLAMAGQESGHAALRVHSASAALVVAALAAASAACAVVVNASAWTWCLGLVAVLLVGIAWPLASMALLRGRLDLPAEPVREGESFDVPLHLTGPRLLPVAGMTLVLDGDVAALSSAADRSTRVTLCPSRRGLYPLTPPRLRCSFPFGLWTVERSVVIARPLLVHPRLVPAARLARFQFRAGASVTAGHHPGDDETAGLRDYRRGDPMRHIHWAATARTGRLIAMDRCRTRAEAVVIRLDVAGFASAPDHGESGWEWAIRAVASIAAAQLDPELDLRVRIGRHEFTLATRRDLLRLLDRLAELPRVPASETPAQGDAAAVVVTSDTPSADFHGAAVVLRIAASGLTSDAAASDEAAEASIRSVPQLLRRLRGIGASEVSRAR
jgi:uncharacterized protein (DUF58 family)